MSGYREKALAEYAGVCERCGEPADEPDTEVHHVDRDRSNESLDNLEVLCKGCHVREHHGPDPLYGLVVSVPAPVLALVDAAGEARGHSCRSETIARAVVDRYDEPVDGDPVMAVSSWFRGDDVPRWSSERVLPDDGRGAGQNTDT